MRSTRHPSQRARPGLLHRSRRARPGLLHRSWRARLGLLLLAIGLVPVAATPVAAETPPRLHAHPPVEPDPTLDLAETIRIALARDPEAVVVEALRDQGRALERASGRWLSGAPALYGSAVTDSPLGSDDGYRQWDAGLELPLWWPGQRAPRRALAEAATTAAGEAARLQRLEVAGRVRAAVAGLALAREQLALAQADREAEARLAERVVRAVELGELAEREALLARSAVLERELAELAALEELRHAEADWHVLTGLGRWPEEWAETPARDARIEDHPALRLAQQEHAEAEANLARLERSGWGQPSLTVGSQHERDDRPSDYSHRLVAGLRVPIGRTDPIASGTLAARRTAAESRRDVLRLERELRARLLRAEHRLDLARDRLATTEAQQRLADDYLARTERGFALGEVDLPTLMQARARARSATWSHHEARLLHRFHVAETNQALGVAP